MKTKKLELKHLAAYLPYNVKMFANGFKGTLQTLNIDNTTQSGYKIRVSCSDWWENNNIDGKIYKPILRPVSDLTKEDIIFFYSLTSIDIELIDVNEWIEELVMELQTNQKFTLSQFEYLFSKHFDVFGLIPLNLAIDINTLTQPK